ncbi:hypothetical protein [Mycolicibacterium porcinum]|nr:hypothetical protein [Mycolicibacterium porcinum]
MRITECATCGTRFRDDPDTAGVCPNGHENQQTDEDFGYDDDYLKRVRI